MAVAVVRSTSAVGTSGSLTFSWSAPTANNLLFTVIGYNFSSATAGPGATPSGWALQALSQNQDTATAGVAVYTKTAAVTDTGPTFNAGTDYCGGAMYEISGANTSTPINCLGIFPYGSGQTTEAITALIESVVGCLVIVGCSEAGDGTSGGTFSMTTGWTTDESVTTEPYHNLGAFHYTTNPSDTTTPTSGTITPARGTTNLVGVVAMINPTGSSAVNPYIVQTGSSNGSSGTAQESVFPVAPTVGNYMLALVNRNSGTVTTPSGWTSLGNSGTADSSGVSALYRLVQSGDTADQAWTFSVSDYNTVSIFEIGNSGGPDTFASQDTTLKAPNLTTTTGELVFNAFGQQTGSAGYEVFATTTPWSNIAGVWSQYRPVAVYTTIAAGSSVTGLTISGADTTAIPIVAVSFKTSTPPPPPPSFTGLEWDNLWLFGA
jgi:hypothetical protein